MKTLLFFIFLLLCVSIPLKSQNKEDADGSQYAFHADAGAAFLFASNVNLEKAFSTYASGSFKLAARVGLGYISIPDLFCDSSSGIFTSAGFTYLIGSSKHHLELSGGGQIKISGNDNNEGGIFECDTDLKAFVPLAEIGYRYQKPEGGILFRVHIGSTGIAVGVGTAW